MSDRDCQVLSPLQKWHKYHRFPFKLLLHTFVLALVILQIYVVSTQFTEYHRSTRGSFEYFFCPESYDQQDESTSSFYRIEDVLDHMQKVVDNYYNLSTSLAVYDHLTDQNGIIAPLLLEMAVYEQVNNDTQSQYATISYYNLTLEDPLGPFNDDINVRQVFYSLSYFTIHFSLKDTGMVAEYGPTQFQWNVAVQFEKPAQGGEIVISLDIQKKITQFNLFPQKLGWLNTIMCAAALLSIFLSLKAIIAGHLNYQRTSERYNAIPETRLLKIFERRKIHPICLKFEELPFKIRSDFYKIWYLVSMLGELMIVLVFSLTLADSSYTPISDNSSICLGLGCLLLCLNFTKYLEYNYTFYTLVLTLHYSTMKAARFTVGILPVFLGFALCGVSLFSASSDRFEDLGATTVTLFSLLNGDDIYATFRELDNAYPFPFVAHVYICSFVILFICCVLNVFIFIIEDGYHLAKVFSSSTLESLSTKTVDHDSLLLWKVLKHKMDMKKLYEIIIEAEVPEYLADLRVSDLDTAYDDDSEGEDDDFDSDNDPRYSTKSQSQSVLALKKVTEGYKINIFRPTPQRNKTETKKVALEQVKERQKEFMQILNKKIEKSQQKFLETVTNDVEEMLSMTDTENTGNDDYLY